MSGLGSRAGVQAGQLGQAQMQQMGDIEAKGLQKAYTDAQKLFAAQKGRERQMAGDIGKTGPAMLQAGLAEQGILQDIGQQKREMAQGALDEAYYKFLKEEAYPQDILASYSGTTYGASPFVGPSGTKTITGGQQPYQQSPGQQLLGLGMQGLNLYGKGTGGFQSDFSWANMFKGKEGGGLSDLPVVRRQSGSAVDFKRLTSGNPPGWSSYSKKLQELRKKREVPSILFDPEGKEVVEVEDPSSTLGGLNLVLDPGEKGIGDYKPPVTKVIANKLAQVKDDPRTLSDNKTLMERLTQRGVKMLGEEVPSAQALEKLKTEKAKEPRFDVELQRQRGEATAAEKEALNIASTAERTAVQEEGYTEESKAMTDYLDKNKKLIDELGGYPGDIIGDAIDQGMEQRGIVRMLSKTLGVTAKGLGKRMKEINSELRKLSTDQFKMEKELRKGKRTDELANLEKKTAVSLRKIVDKAGLQTKLDDLPAKAQQAAMTELKNIAALRVSDYEKLAKVVSMLDKLTRANAAAAKGAGTGKSITSFIDRIHKDVVSDFGWTLGAGGEIQVKAGQSLTEPEQARFNEEYRKRKRSFMDRVEKLDPKMSTYQSFNRAYSSIIPTGTQGSSKSNAITLPKKITQADLDKIPVGTWIINPKTNNPIQKT